MNKNGVKEEKDCGYRIREMEKREKWNEGNG